MALKTTVKINHVNNLSDARYCAGMGVKYLGFNLENEGEYFINPQEFAEITGWVSGPEYIAEFDEYGPDDIAETLKNYKVDLIEVTKPEIIKDLTNLEKPMVLKLDIDKYRSFPELKTGLSEIADITEFVIIVSKQPGRINQTKLAELSESFNLMAGYGINEKNVNDLIDKTNIAGIALDGGKESRVGFKDYDQLADILEAIDADEVG